jgi:tRNA A-37 threonylcarbamoyl transferase component Bud32/Tol biopolymer transport system component
VSGGPAARLAAALADRYRLERELGQGGMATVYLAQDLRHDRQVAIKVLRPELAAVLGADRFVQEIKTTAALQHPHILPLFDSGSADGFLYYVMPYVEGETLRTKLDREKQLGVEEAVRITTEVADALDYAHRHGVIHRDIKPENILLHDGRPMVADFGIALAVSAAAGGRMTETGMSLGTPHYMSPEQATAEKEITGRSDVYSLASVLYEMLTGNPPHTGASAQQIIMKIIAEPVPVVTTLRKSVPPNVAAALMKALEKLPADRFDSAAAFAAALENPHFTTQALAPTIEGPTGGPWKRRFYVASGACALLAIALMALMLGRGRSPIGAELSFEQETFGKEHVFNGRWAPDGKTIVYSAVRGGTTPRLYVVRPDYPEPERLGPDSTELLSVSSTGELALLAHARRLTQRLFRGTLARMPLGGGAPREVLDGVIEADWSPDGSQLAISRLDTTYRIIHMLLEYPVGKVLYRPAAGGYVSDIRVSPSGDRVAFCDHATFGDDRGVVKIVDAAGRVATLTPEFWGLEGLAWERGGRSLLFSGADRGGMYQVHRATIAGGERLALPSPGTLTLQDVARDGAWLATRDDWSDRLIVRAPGSPGIRDVSWLNSSANPIISRDGQLLAFEDASAQAGLLYATMIRKTDGSPVARLGDGLPRAMSPDKRWVLAAVLTTPTQYRLYPTGAGQTVPVQWNLATVTVTDFFPDGRHLLVCGNAPHKAPACYRSALDGSALEQVTPDSVPGGGIRPDGRAIAYLRDGDWWIRSFADRRDRRIPGFPKDFGPLRWRPDGSALWGHASRDPQHLEQLDVATGRLTPLVTLELPADVSPAELMVVSLADDPRVYAYMARAETSLIFSIRGVR